MISTVPSTVTASTFLAHGIGGRTDLPLPTPLATLGAVLAVLISFIAITVRWPGPRPADLGGWALPVRLQQVLDSRVFRDVLRTLVLVFTVFVTVVALTGPPLEGLNLAPYAVYITFWVGLVPASLLLGPIWRIVNPLRYIDRGLGRLADARKEETRRIPIWLGWWPAAAWVALFVWFELVFPDRTTPSLVGLLIVVYASVNIMAAGFYGSGWFDRGDGFEAYSALVATLSPLGRRADRRLVVRNPVDGPLALRSEPGLVAIVMVLIGSTAFDGVTRTRFWVEEIPADSIRWGTAGLAGMTLAVTGLYLAAIAIMAKLTKPSFEATASKSQTPGGPRSETRTDHPGKQVRPPALTPTRLPGLFAPSLVPIAVGYAIAHYASLFFYEGQGTWILLSDPFNTGANYFGTRSHTMSPWFPNIDYTVVSLTTVTYLQVGAIVLGHSLAVVVAHYRAVSLFDKPTARRSQYPLMVLMLFLTGMAVTLLVNT